MPRASEITEESARYKITSDDTEPSYRSTIDQAVANAANRVGLGYDNTQITFLKKED